jgi:ubiquinone/menaquinone biosynthesis C-methylase UbiE
MSNDDSIREVIRHYGDVDESSRVRTSWFQLEQARTQELILRHLPPPPTTVIDAGGGAGAYACWLAAHGYQVHLIDPVPRHVEQARAASSQAQPSTCLGGGGRRAQAASRRRHPDAVLPLGPLYHLVETEDRLACLREAHRVLRPGGLVWGAAISHFASLFDSLSSGFFDDSAFAPILARDLEEGQHRNTTGNPLYFTDAFFHRPEELAHEFVSAGFQVLDLVAIEGPGWLARDFNRLWNDPQQRERVLVAVTKVEHEPSVASSHIMAIARK